MVAGDWAAQAAPVGSRSETSLTHGQTTRKAERKLRKPLDKIDTPNDTHSSHTTTHQKINKSALLSLLVFPRNTRQSQSTMSSPAFLKPFFAFSET
jgi:hypothetical protein